VYRYGVKSGLRSDPGTWRDERQRRGLEGERRAIRFLEARGWEVMAHRFRVGRIEIDLVARRGPLVAFIEVKVRRSAAFGSPLEAVTWSKQRELTRAAHAWVDRFGRPGDVYRFDCIGIAGGRLAHVEDAFRPGWR